MNDASPEMLSIFAAAIEQRSPEERSAFLDSACGSDMELRQRIEALLRAHDNAGGFLDSPAPAAFSVASTKTRPTESPGDTIGPYRLLQQIGEGGMGTVFMAEQSSPVGRRVALKLIKPGMDSRQVISRFEAERQALAMMDHPNIAKVLDAGTTDSGQPYFVMELVQGVSVTEYCDQQHLTPRERLELFIPICQAIQHAHQKGIIHRDLKPSNILVARYDDKPVPKIIDFGVAKAISQKLTEKTIFTQFGQIVGTIEYMSPEQAQLNQLDVDTRSDIYSLGVLLYELLTGETPFDKQRLRSAAFDEVLRIIREEEPPQPSTRLSSSQMLPSIAADRRTEPHKLSRLIRGELDWIVMKALEKDRGRRYAPANAFALDVQRHLNDEQVEACPPSTFYRLQKFSSRHRVYLVMATLLTAALLLGTGISFWQAVLATRAKQLALEQTEVAEKQRKRAEAHLSAAREAVDQLTKLGQDSLSHVPRMEQTRREILETALQFQQRFLDEESDAPLVRYEMGLALQRVGHIRRDLGNQLEAADAFRRAAAIFEQLRTEYPAHPDYKDALARSKTWLGELTRSDLPQATKTVKQAIQLQTELVDAYPEKTAYRESLLESLQVFAHIVLYAPNSRDDVAAEEMLQRASQVWQQMPPATRRPVDPTSAMLGDVYFRTGRPEKAEKTWKTALLQFEALVADNPANWEFRSELAHRYGDLGRLAESAGRLQDAEEFNRQSLALWDGLVEDFPGVSEFASYRKRTLSILSNLLRVAGKNSESIEFYHKCVQQTQLFVEKYPTLSDQRLDLAWVLASHPDPRSRDPVRALQLAQDTTEGPGRSYTKSLLYGVAYFWANDLEASKQALEETVTKIPDGRFACAARLFLAMIHWKQGDPTQARTLYDQACEWITTNAPYDGRLKQFQEEAEELMRDRSDN